MRHAQLTPIAHRLYYVHGQSCDSVTELGDDDTLPITVQTPGFWSKNNVVAPEQTYGRARPNLLFSLVDIFGRVNRHLTTIVNNAP
jgi:hypothetical protein